MKGEGGGGGDCILSKNKECIYKFKLILDFFSNQGQKSTYIPLNF